jgi:hypothetical protein
MGTRCIAGPFGFEYGMTNEHVISLVGEAAVDPSSHGDILHLTTAPRPHPHFESYTLKIPPEVGLLDILAFGRVVSTTRYGDELKDAFIDIRNAISVTYGKPRTYDFLRAGSIWEEPEDWMDGLLKKERTLNSFWSEGLTLPNHIHVITLEAVALTTEGGMLILGYEFDGFQEYMEAQKAEDNQVF